MTRYRHFEEPVLNRSLERGMDVLRTFRPGSDLLGNGELAERTGLSPATVSRLTQTLVRAGFLEHDRARRAYRLAAPVLSLAHAMRSGSPVLKVAGPLMRSLAEKLKVNVGLAVPDGDDMVYIESVRHNRKVSLRTVVSGQRVPVELTSLGRAWLACLSVADRREAMLRIKARRARSLDGKSAQPTATPTPVGWRSIEREIAQALLQYQDQGFVSASWQPGVLALARPLQLDGYAVHVFNISVADPDNPEKLAEMLSFHLMELVDAVRARLESL